MSGSVSQMCPMFYECTKIQITPMIRALRRCSADEAMRSICADCEEKPLLQEVASGERYMAVKKSC